VALEKYEIGPRSTYQKGDMFKHNKHGFIVQIIGAGEWRDIRRVKVVSGKVPISLLKARGGTYFGHGFDENEYSVGYEMEYNTCSLSACFTRLGPAGRILFGEKK